jgi:hypothetical protein
MRLIGAPAKCARSVVGHASAPPEPSILRDAPKFLLLFGVPLGMLSDFVRRNNRNTVQAALSWAVRCPLAWVGAPPSSPRPGHFLPRSVTQTRTPSAERIHSICPATSPRRVYQLGGIPLVRLTLPKRPLNLLHHAPNIFIQSLITKTNHSKPS